MNIQPYTIAVPQATLDDLHERLADTRWPDEAVLPLDIVDNSTSPL